MGMLVLLLLSSMWLLKASYGSFGLEARVAGDQRPTNGFIMASNEGKVGSALWLLPPTYKKTRESEMQLYC